jgi:F-type H+/Na+-transporting ATPase subunit beta
LKAFGKAAITTLYMGMGPFDLEVFGKLDALVSFSPERANEGLYPCVDPVHSKSVVLSSNAVSDEHKTLVRETQDALYQYYRYNLHGASQRLGLDFTYLEDAGGTESLILRARRLAYF